VGLSSSATLDTPAGGTDAALSAGQKQLLTFGRTLMQESYIVVMDEPTANVDMQTDRLLQMASRKTFETRTVIMIAHRLDTVKDCDRIAVMDAGKLAELGTFEELCKNPDSHLAKLARAAERGVEKEESHGAVLSL